MSRNKEEQYCIDRSDCESAISDLFSSGQAAGLTNEQILSDVKDALYNIGVKVEIIEE
jgi:hypothetical protein